MSEPQPEYRYARYAAHVAALDDLLEQYRQEAREDAGRPRFVSYADRLRLHIRCVQDAGLRLGVPEAQLAQHDVSKWTPEEFGPYARHFIDGGSAVDAGQVQDDMVVAWLTHMHRNPHHWQHWIFPDGYTPAGSGVEKGVVRMPIIYALEMVADWIGASKAYTGSEDMTQWLWKNMPRIRLHSETADYVRGVLDMLGYADTVVMQRFAHEPE